MNKTQQPAVSIEEQAEEAAQRLYKACISNPKVMQIITVRKRGAEKPFVSLERVVELARLKKINAKIVCTATRQVSGYLITLEEEKNDTDNEMIKSNTKKLGFYYGSKGRRGEQKIL